jgi:phosphonate transport system ATP-binding protein
LSETPLLEARGLALRYADGTEALKGIDLVLPRGQFCVLLGPSGSGKSTLLRLINGLARPSAGSLQLDGRALRPQDLRRRGQQMASIHQSAELVPRLSVLNNVLTGDLGRLPLWRALLGYFGRARQQRACALLQEVGLDERQLYRRAAELSGGQQQRVGIARAFMCEPQLVLADEPVASLDPKISRDILELLRRAAHAHGAAVLCSLHQVDLALAFADRILGLRDGLLQWDRTPATLSDADLQALYDGAPPLAAAA